MGACGCFDSRKIISKNKNNKINEIIDQVENSIIKLKEMNDDQPETQKGDNPIYENKNYDKNEKSYSSDKIIVNDLNMKKNNRKRNNENNENKFNNEKNRNNKNNNENTQNKNITNNIESPNYIGKENNNNNEKENKKEKDNEKENKIEKGNENKKENKKQKEPNENENDEKKKIKKEEPEKDNNKNKIEKKQKIQNNENKLIDNENDENKKEKNKNNKDFNKSENNKEKETDISLYRYPSNFEIINKSSSLLKDIREINIVLIGEKQSGKSSFVIKLAENRFENLYIPTVFIETISKVMTYNNKRYVLNFDVTPGEQEYQQDYSTLYAKSNFIFLFYDVTNLGSFLRAKKFIKKELKNKVIMYSHNFSNIFIIGNKIDSTPFIESSTQIRSYCEKHQLEFFEISVKTNAGIGYMMNKLLAIFDSISSI